MYYFNRPLIEAKIIKRKSQFSFLVNLDGNEIVAHCPITGRIGDIETKNIACLLSYSDYPKRKMPYTVEAISCDDLDSVNKRWVGINQILSNKLIEHFFKEHSLDEIESNVDVLKREVKLGVSKLDFKVGDTYIEVKTPLVNIQVEYGNNITTKPVTPFSSTDRFVKHIKELTASLDSHEKASLIVVYQYIITNRKERQKSTNYEEVSRVIEEAKNKGVTFYDIEFEFMKDGVKLHKISNTFK